MEIAHQHEQRYETGRVEHHEQKGDEAEKEVAGGKAVAGQHKAADRAEQDAAGHSAGGDDDRREEVGSHLTPGRGEVAEVQGQRRRRLVPVELRVRLKCHLEHVQVGEQPDDGQAGQDGGGGKLPQPSSREGARPGRQPWGGCTEQTVVIRAGHQLASLGTRRPMSSGGRSAPRSGAACETERSSRERSCSGTRRQLLSRPWRSPDGTVG